MPVRTNLTVLKPRQKPPERGDIFVMQLPNGAYLFGRVVFANVPQERAPMPGAHLIYIYDRRSQTPQPLPSQLRPGRLLIAPIWTNALAWTKGYFQTIRNQPIGDFDLLREHCFFMVPLGSAASGKFVDETGKEVGRRSDPCGEWALASYRWIDDHVSDALGISRAPEE